MDVDKLNRIKRVLKAQGGAKTPYVVKSGDTLGKIVANYNRQNGTNLNYKDVATWSGIKNPNVIKIGQKIYFEDPNAPAEIAQAVSTTPTTSDITTQGVEVSTPENTSDVTEVPQTPIIANPTPTPTQPVEQQNAVVPRINSSLYSTVKNMIDQGDIKWEIPGSLNLTPTTAVEKSSDVMQAAQMKTDEISSDVLAAKEAQQIQSASSGDNLSQSLNASPATGLQLPSQEDLKKSTMDMVKNASVGMNVDFENQAALNALKQKQQQARNTKAGMIAQFGTQAFTAVGDALGAAQAANDSELTQGITTGYKAVQNIASNFGPIGQAVSGVMGIASAAGDILQSMGGGTDQQSTLDKWMDSPLLSWNVGAINGFFGKNSDTFAVDSDAIEQVGSSYGGSVSDLNDAAKKANKKYGLFSSKSRKKANDAIAKAKSTQNLMADIGDTAEDQRLAVQSMGEQAGLAYSMITSGGYDQKYTYAAKQGGILEWNPVTELEWEPQIELNWELPTFKKGGNIDIIEELEWIPELQKGGSLKDKDIPEIEETNQKNVIPEGALHKNKHHMDHAEGLTKKGIPVIDEDGEQQAEIEHSEIIFTLEVTKKLEEYYEIFYSEETSNKEKEQAALETGKLLVYQILENTEDRTGLIESCKKGGSLTLKKSTDDLIEEALEWMPTITIIEQVQDDSEENEPNEDKKSSKKHLKSDKDLMKEAIKEVLIELLTK